MPKFEPKKPQSVGEQIQFAQMYTVAMGGTVGQNEESE